MLSQLPISTIDYKTIKHSPLYSHTSNLTPTQTPHQTFSTFSALPQLQFVKMVRGAEYDNGVPQSDNPIENGPNKAHGVGDEVRYLHFYYL
mgnify:CR=1 FL=1|jgi:hypothetical protein